MDYSHKWCLNKNINENFIFCANFAFRTPILGVYFKHDIKGLLGENFTNYKDLKISLEKQFPNDYLEIIKELKKEELLGDITLQILKCCLKSAFKDIKQYGLRSLFW